MIYPEYPVGPTRFCIVYISQYLPVQV